MLLIVVFVFAGYTDWRRETLSFEPEKKAALSGTVCAKPYEQADKHRTVLMLDDAVYNGEALPFRVYMYIYGGEGSFEYGQTLTASGASCWQPAGVRNPGGFDFSLYLAGKGAGMCASASASAVQIEQGRTSLRRALFRVSDELAQRLDRLFPENADVMRALLLGDRGGMTDDVYDDFRTSGIAHLVALSGFHVSLIAGMIELALMLLLVPKRLRGILAVALLYLYALMTGASPSVIRAFLMFAFHILARERGLYSDLLTRIGAAFLTQTALNPLILYQTGFMLSYASVLALALVQKPLLPLLGSVKGRLKGTYAKAAQAVSVSAAAQLGTLPFTASAFHTVAALAIPVNLIIVPLGLITIYAGMAALMLDFVLPGAARVLALPADGIWTLIKGVIAFVSEISFARLSARAWTGAALGAYFIMLVAVSPYFSNGGRRAKLLTSAAVAFALVVTLMPPWPHKGLSLVFLDAGYADSCVVYAENDVYIVDCGKNNNIIADYLSAKGADVKGVFLTHPDSDHVGGAAEVLKRYPNAKVYVSECWERMDISTEIAAAIPVQRLTKLSAGDTVALAPEITAQVVWPYEGYAPAADNDGSLVLKIVYGEAEALLTGDITNKEDKNLREDCDVLKVAHHGSKYASSAEMLAYASPQMAVISVASNGYGHPTEEVLSRLAEVGAAVYRTDERGAIMVDMFKNGEIRVECMLSGGSAS